MSTEYLPAVDEFFERFPDAQEVYASDRLYHLTHSLYVPGIEADGLRPNRELFPAEQGKFLLQMYDKHGNGMANERDYISNRILDPSHIYLSTSAPDFGHMRGYTGYGVPERLAFLMRGMKTLAAKVSLDEDDRNYASSAFDAHYQSLTENDPRIVALEVDPLAPAVVNSRLGQYALWEVSDKDLAVHVAKYADQYPQNIPVSGEIPPQHITVHDSIPLNPDHDLSTTNTEATWAASIR